MDTTPPTENGSEIIDDHVRSFLNLLDQMIERLVSEFKPSLDDN